MRRASPWLTRAHPSACSPRSASRKWSTPSADSRLGRIFMNRTIRVYPDPLSISYGMEETIERIVGYFPPFPPQGPRRAQAGALSAGPGRRRQILARRALETPDGEAADLCAEGPAKKSARSSKARWVSSIRCVWATCSKSNTRSLKRRLAGLISPWALKRLDEFGGDIYPNSPSCACTPRALRQVAVSKTEPGRRKQPRHFLAGR